MNKSIISAIILGSVVMSASAFAIEEKYAFPPLSEPVSETSTKNAPSNFDKFPVGEVLESGQWIGQNNDSSDGSGNSDSSAQ